MYPEQVRNFIAGHYSAEDEQFVKEWVKQEAGRAQRLEELKKVWVATGHLSLAGPEEAERARASFFNKVERRDQTVSPVTELSGGSRSGDHWRVIFRAAAVLLVVAGLFALYFFNPPEPEEPAAPPLVYQTIRAQYGEQVKTYLGDGSSVTLNAGSSIRLNNKYGIENRDLYLKGEAFFEVNNEGQSEPFVVYTDEAVVRDISTSFNVNAYEEHGTTSVVVVKGEVEVAAGDSLETDNTVLVRKGRMVNVSGDEDTLVVKKADLDLALGWLNKKLIFDNDSFEDIVKKLERYYDIEITVHNDSLKSKVIKAAFENESMEKVMSVLAISLGAEYEINGNKVSFRSK